MFMQRMQMDVDLRRFGGRMLATIRRHLSPPNGCTMQVEDLIECNR
jgi:hypothetical protein